MCVPHTHPVVDQQRAREGAQSLLSSIIALNRKSGDERKVRQLLTQISVTVEIYEGEIKSTILAMVRMYRPDSLIIGTRGKQVSALEKMLGTTPLGNLSKQLIWQSPVPVTIVRPKDRIQKHLSKRLTDPRRQEYADLVKDDEALPMSRARSHS